MEASVRRDISMKQILGIAVIALLAGILIFNFAEKNKEQSAADTDKTAVNISKDPDVKGAAIVSPGKSSIEPGQPAPDFELESLDGDTVRLSDFRGKKVFLNFWASWCGPCRIEMPEMQKFYDEHKDEVEIVAVNTEPNVGKARNFIEENGYTYPILLDKDMKVANQYAIFGLPTTYFIGTDGKIQQEKKVGPMTYEFMTETLHSLE